VTPLAIPDNTTVESSITVSGVTGQITNLTAAFYITHTFDADLTISLVGPDGTVVPLSVENGGSANNYGSACSPVTSRTTFDDGTATLVTHGQRAVYRGLPSREAAGRLQREGRRCRERHLEAPDPGLVRRRHRHAELLVAECQPGSNPLSADFDGDTRADMALYKSNGEWAILKSSSNFTSSLVKSWGGAATPRRRATTTATASRISACTARARRLARAEVVHQLHHVVLDQLGGAGYKPEPATTTATARPIRRSTTRPRTWSALKSSTSYTTVIGVSWGGAGFTRVPGQDFDGDSKSDMVVYAQATGVWSILKSSTNFTTASSIGWAVRAICSSRRLRRRRKADPGIYNKASGAWNILLSASNYVTSRTIKLGRRRVPAGAGRFRWRSADRCRDLPDEHRQLVRAEVVERLHHGDQRDRLGLGQRPAVSAAINVGGSDTTRATDLRRRRQVRDDGLQLVHRRVEHPEVVGGYTTALSVGLGGSGYAPMPGDFDGDGKTDVAVYQSTTGNWYVLLSSTSYTTSLSKNAGGTGWAPVPADYDGDGKTDFAVYNTSSGIWFVLKSSTTTRPR
jgi:hypothetical protein